MALTSLLVCADAETVQVLHGILDDLEVGVEICGDPRMARARIDDYHFDAILIDGTNEETAIGLISHVRKAPANQNTVAIALLNGGSQVRDLFEAGANFILYKPISRERALHSIRAARSLMRRERRARPRIPVETSASIAYAGTENASASLLDVSEEGVALRYNRQLPPCCKVYFQFALPGNRALVQLSGEVMWQDSSGRVGIRFAHVPQTSRRILKDWLQTKLSQQASGRQVSQDHKDNDATVEAPPATAEDASLRLSAGLGLMSVSAADRRERARHSCTLGAEVFRVGNSVPVRCTVSDVSTGGCFVETTEPFSIGTSLEIVVRTADVKLQVHGKVRSVNRGFGMGIEFSLKTQDQQKQVEQLLACARAEPKLTG